jgi:hypothetical protein
VLVEAHVLEVACETGVCMRACVRACVRAWGRGAEDVNIDVEETQVVLEEHSLLGCDIM